MADFLDTAHKLWKTGQVNNHVDSFERTFKGISTLQQVHSKSQLDIQNIESVFAAFDMAKTIGRFSNYPRQDVDNLSSSIAQVIVATVEKTLNFPVHPDSRIINDPPPYGDFLRLFRRLADEATPKQTVSVLTFNYDLALDFSFYKDGYSVDYGLDEQNSSSGPTPLLKLHGSVNWTRCTECKSVIPLHLRDYFEGPQPIQLPGPTSVYINLSHKLKSMTHCNKPVDPTPVIVPPTWNKNEYHRSISNVWAHAAKELSEAENIFVMGYSLPESDAFFRYLFALGTVSDVTLKRFWVFNPDSSPSTRERYEKLLGPGAQQRFKYFPETFADGIQHLWHENSFWQ
jgi:NAD-dependent SIR2 family protein deacetylase